jgi:hypothetical protein
MHVERHLGLELLISLTLCLLGCGDRMRALKVVSAGQIGCPPDEIEISDLDRRFADTTWTATCRGIRHICSAYVSGSSGTGLGYGLSSQGGLVLVSGLGGSSHSYNCKAELSSDFERGGYDNYSSTEQITPRTATSGAPNGAAGFAFGDTEAVAAKACIDAGYQWSKPSGANNARCTGSPVSVGFEASVEVVFCGDKVCALILRRPLEDLTSDDDLLARYNTTTDLVKRKYGAFSSRKHNVPDDCRKDLKRCIADGEVQLQTKWQWSGGQTVRVVLGQAERIPYLFLLYRDVNQGQDASGL